MIIYPTYNLIIEYYFLFKITENGDGSLSIEKRLHNDWKDSFSPYVAALEDKIIVVDGGQVSTIFAGTGYKALPFYQKFLTQCMI